MGRFVVGFSLFVFLYTCRKNKAEIVSIIFPHALGSLTDNIISHAKKMQQDPSLYKFSILRTPDPERIRCFLSVLLRSSK